MIQSKEAIKQECESIIVALTTLRDDDGVPKNVKTKIDGIISNLNNDIELSVKIGKSLHSLDDISEDLNLQPFLRTQIWNVSSMLEKLNH